jgi:hypothetical protein
MKEMEKEFLNVQENYMQEKRKKEEKMVDNRGYLTNLIKERDREAHKLEKLNQRRTQIEEEERLAILKLKHKLEGLQTIYENNKNRKVSLKQKPKVSIQLEQTEHWVKRVTLN